MVQQARVLAATLSERGSVDGDEAARILANMRRNFDARLRVFDPALTVVADSSVLGSDSGSAARTEPAEEAELAAEPETRENWIYRLGSFLYGLYARIFLPPEPPLPANERDATVEEVRTQVMRDALENRYRARSVISPKRRSLTLYSAIPIRDGQDIVGGVLVSKSTFQLLQALYDLRLSIFKVVLASVVAAIFLSLFVATTIARPIQRLRSEARAILDRRGRLLRRFKGSRRRDEIGDLSRALAELTRRLEGHIRFIESFASDVSHEFKNPLAAIRNATELLAEVEEPETRQRFLGMILQDIARLEHLLSGVREISRLDAGIEEDPVETVDLAEMLSNFVDHYRLQPCAVDCRLRVAEADTTVEADPERLIQVFENLLDNAASFSPAGGEVWITLDRQNRQAIVTLQDQGPGIPEEHLELIFSRFFSYRENGTSADGHTGLGLAIVRTIIEGYGGTVIARNAEQRGAVFEVRLPLSG